MNTANNWWLKPARLFDGKRWHQDRALFIKNGQIERLGQQKDIPVGSHIMTTPHTACPGYIDLQINGGGGVMFNNEPTLAGLKAIGEAHARYGTTSFLPTVITDTADKLDQAADAVIATIGQYGVVGIHIEGPHINEARKGTHAKQFIRPFDDRTLKTLERLRAAHIPTMLTLAPECLPDITIIAKLVAQGIVVSAGHTNAKGEEVRAATAQGLSCFTHLHNAMTPMTSRESGVVGEALAGDAWCGLICDGYHICDTTLAVSLKAKEKADRLFIVSDAMSTVGGPASFMLYGEEIFVSDGRLINSQGALAGAHTTMADGVRHLVSRLRLEVKQALAMATSFPAEVMSLQGKIGMLKEGARADILLLQENWHVAEVIRKGQFLHKPK